MLRYYNIFYYFVSIFNWDENKGIIYSIKQHKMKNYIILLQICLLSGLIAITNVIYNKEIIKGLINVDPNKMKNIIYAMSTIGGILAPIISIISLFIFLLIISKFQVIISNSLKKEIFSLAIISYIPILIASFLNLLLNIIFGFNEFGYLSMYGFIQPENKVLITIVQELNPFKMISIFIACYLYTRLYNKNHKQLILLIFFWYTLNIIFSMFSG